MNILAIESSCDETACAIVQDGRKIISSVVYSQIEEHKIYGGVVPEIASRLHIEKIDEVVAMAVERSGLFLKEIDAIAVTAGPGLIGGLLVGVNFAKGLALALNIPVIPVHHIRGHIAACYLSDKDFTPPFLCLAASGGNSLIVDVRGYTEFKILGRSRDDAAGEAFDKVSRAMGLGYPGGAQIDALARKGNDNAYKLPQAKVENSPLDMSFSGVKTSVVNLLHNSAQKGIEIKMNDLAASFEKNVCDALISRLMLAQKQGGHQSVAVVGGVAANTRLRRDLVEECTKRSLRVLTPPLSLTGDNAAMIGAQGYFELMAGHVGNGRLNAVATLSLENVLPESFCV